MKLEVIREKMIGACQSANIHTEKIEMVLDEWKKRKGPLMEAIGLNEENGYRVNVTVNATLKDRHDIYQFMRSVACRSKYDINDFTTMLQGKNVVKLGKILPKTFDRVLYASTLANLMSSLGIAGHYSSYQNTIGSDPESAASQKMIHNFLVMYGDYVKNGRGLILSANPFDMMTASHNSTYKSCMRIGGEYFNGVISHILSPDVLIAFIHDVKSIEKKVGRQWVYVNDTLYWGGRYYGAFYDSDGDLIRNKVLASKRFEGKWEQTDMGLDQAHVDRAAGWIYLDYNYNKVWRKAGIDRKKIVIPVGPCLSCGKPLDHAKEGNCMACISKHQKRCVACNGKIVAGQHTWVWLNKAGNQFIFHKNCFDSSLMPCAKCKNATPAFYMRRGLYTISEDGKRIQTNRCKDCEPETHECSVCGGFWVEEHIHPLRDTSGRLYKICTKCAKVKDNYTLCPKCKAYHYTGRTCYCQKEEKVAV